MIERHVKTLTSALFRTLLWGLIACCVAVVALVVFLVLGSSCRRRERDVSDVAEYAERVGQRCTVLKGLVAHGVTNIDGNHVLVITTPPGIGGRHVTFQEAVPKGSELVVTRVTECWNCPFDRITYRLKVESSVPRIAREEGKAGPDVLSPDEVLCRNP